MSNTPITAVPPASSALDARSLIEALQQLRKTSVAELDWNRYCTLMRQLCKATHCAVVRRLPETDNLQLLGRVSELETWSPLQVMPQGVDLLERARQQGYASAPAQGSDQQSWLVLVVALQGIHECFLILNIKPQERALLNELTLRALLSADFSNAATDPAAPASASEDLTSMLGLAADVMQQSSFAAASLALVNGLTVRWKLAQASLAWADRMGQLELTSISHLDRFERNATQTQRLETALLPAVQQGRVLWWPEGVADPEAEHALDELAQELAAEKIALIPLQDEQGNTVSALFLAFAQGHTSQDFDSLMIALELMQPRLSDLRQRSLSLRRRAQNSAYRTATRLLGPENPFLKLLGILLCVLLVYLIFGTWHYRVEASAQLNTDATRLITAQFDGRIDQVHVTAGDWVKPDQLLVTLDTRELLQQRQELSAEISKIETEINKYRADGLLAETEISSARLRQALTKAERIDAYLQQARSHAPFEGVIVEGEKKDLLGAPVKKGDRIFRLAKVEGLYVTLMVSEKEMRHIAANAQGELALLSQPAQNIAFRVSSVIPVAQVKGQEGNQFTIKAELLEPPQPWWRPGMTGLARIDVGEKNVAWVLTHRIVDRLRLLLWW